MERKQLTEIAIRLKKLRRSSLSAYASISFSITLVVLFMSCIDIYKVEYIKDASAVLKISSE